MATQVVRTGAVRDPRTGLSCSTLRVGVGGLEADLPALSATYSDYDHASRAGRRLDAGTFNYYHRVSASGPLGHRSTLENIAARVRAVQRAHKPPLTLISVEQPSGDLGDGDLAAFHEMQRRLDLPFITTAEKSPEQDVEGLREELERLDRFDARQNILPTISARSGISNFEKKLQHVVRNYSGFNLQWGGYSAYFDRWALLSATLRDHAVWCNVVGITPRYVQTTASTGQKIRPSNIVNAVLCGGHSYCIAWPRRQPQTPVSKRRARVGKRGDKAIPRKNPMLFDPGTWCYDPCDLANSVARTVSFNSMQASLGTVRKKIRDGTFYGAHCPETLGLREALARISKSAAGMPAN